jgi:hypothetical protein
MSKISIIIFFIPKIEPSSIVGREPQCFLQLFLPRATWLKSFAIKCESRTCRKERVKLESRNKVLVEIKGESKIGQREKTRFEITFRIAKR